MKVNWKRFAGLFALFTVVLLCNGCGWISVAEGLIQPLSVAVGAIVSFVFSLEGKTVPASVTAFIQKIEQDIQTELTNLKTLLAAAQSGGATVLSQIGAVLSSIISNLNSILGGLNVTDSSTLQKITELVGLAVAAVQAILAIVPLATAKLAENPSDSQLKAFDKVTATHLGNIHKQMQSRYKEVVTTPTGEAVVDTALAALPQTLP